MKKTATLFVLGAALGLAGCAGTPNTAKSGDSEYEYVTPLGSNIPVRVKKGQTATNTMAPSTTMSGADGAALINSAGGKVPTDRSGTR